MERFNTSDVEGERGHELRAAFGEDTDMVRLEEDDLERVPDKKWELEEKLEEGDWVTIQHPAGNVTTGPVTEVKSYGFTIDPRNRTTSGFFGYESFEEGRGITNEIIDINGCSVDINYEPAIVE